MFIELKKYSCSHLQENAKQEVCFEGVSFSSEAEFLSKSKLIFLICE